MGVGVGDYPLMQCTAKAWARTLVSTRRGLHYSSDNRIVLCDLAKGKCSIDLHAKSPDEWDIAGTIGHEHVQ